LFEISGYVDVDMRHMPRVRAKSDTVVEGLRKNAAILNPGAEPEVAIEQDRLKRTMDPAFDRTALINPRQIRCYLESYLATCGLKSGWPEGNLVS
jgi:hypothetical protein